MKRSFHPIKVWEMEMKFSKQSWPVEDPAQRGGTGIGFPQRGFALLKVQCLIEISNNKGFK